MICKPLRLQLFALLSSAFAMFQSQGDRLSSVASTQTNYGVAVADVDNDGQFEWMVAGFEAPNLVLKYNHTSGKYQNLAIAGSEYAALADARGAAIGLCACDLDGDGREEIYILNTNDAFAGRTTYKDKLFKWHESNGYEDLLSLDVNKDLDLSYAGQSVACLDRFGTGQYSFVVATYSANGEGQFSLIEMDAGHADNHPESGVVVLRNVARQAGIGFANGGRGVVVGSIVSSAGLQDVFFVSEKNVWLNNTGTNYLLRNRGDGTFEELSNQRGLDLSNNRAVVLNDLNHDSRMDLVVSDMNGQIQVLVQNVDDGHFVNKYSLVMQRARHSRTLLAADFDNDGWTELFVNNKVHTGFAGSNEMYRISIVDGDLQIDKVSCGDALENGLYGTGAAYADVDGDGFLELLVAHGGGEPQCLTIYQVPKNGNRYIRLAVTTAQGAPARGATVNVTLSSGRTLTTVIDNGSGHMCQMEPVAHFGLGTSERPLHAGVTWPGGASVLKTLTAHDVNRLIRIAHPLRNSV